MKRIKETQTIVQQEVKSFKEPMEDKNMCGKYPHQFFKVGEETKYIIENMQSVPIRWGTKVICALCGQQRNLWTDGEVETL